MAAIQPVVFEVQHTTQDNACKIYETRKHYYSAYPLYWAFLNEQLIVAIGKITQKNNYNCAVKRQLVDSMYYSYQNET